MEQVLIDLDRYRTDTSSSNDINVFLKYGDPDHLDYNTVQPPECRRIVKNLKQFDIPLMCCYYDGIFLKHRDFYSENKRFLTDDGRLIQWDEIYCQLEQERVEFVQIFKNYLAYFVEKISDSSEFISYAQKQSAFLTDFSFADFTVFDIVISFNYTKTFEKLPLRLLFGDKRIDRSKVALLNAQSIYPLQCFHIHGRVEDENIVMGIKPNDDGIEPLHFQKDVQRFRYGTNSSCIRWLRSIHSKDINLLTVMGCSLDVTDGDIIKKLFNKSHQIRILYYGDDDDGYCKNIKSILGTDGLELIQERFVFQKIDDCKSEYANKKYNANYMTYDPKVKEFKIGRNQY